MKVLFVDEIRLEKVEVRYRYDEKLKSLIVDGELVEEVDVVKAVIYTEGTDIVVIQSEKTGMKANIRLDIFHGIYRIELLTRDGRKTIEGKLYEYEYDTLDIIKTDGGDPIDKNPKIHGEVKIVKGFKALIKRDFKVVLDWMEKHIEDYARNLSEEEIQRLEDYIHRLRAKWNSHNIKY